MMKNKMILIVLLIVSQISFSQTTAIPDSNFEQALIDLNIDSDGIINGQVLTSDINTVISLDVSNKNISDLTGIEDFISIVILNVYVNNLTAINLSSNSLLEEFYGGNNNLNVLNIGQNTLLKKLVY